jgi:hypothetical protein
MPGGITLLYSLPADIPTPPAGKATIFINLATGEPSYKDSAGVTRTLVGAAGATGAQGPLGNPGFAFDGEEGDTFVALPGPQGNTGPTGTTGSQGPAGPIIIDEGIPGEDAIPGGGAAAAAVSSSGLFLPAPYAQRTGYAFGNLTNVTSSGSEPPTGTQATVLNDATAGVLVRASSAVSGTVCSWRFTNLWAAIGDHNPTWRCRLRIGTITSVRFWAGLGPNVGLNADAPAANNALFRFSTVAGDTGFGSFTTTSGAVATSNLNLNTVNAGQFYNLRITVRSAGTAYDFYIDDVLVATHTTNLPATSTAVLCHGTITPQVAALRTLDMFYHYMEVPAF